MQSQRACMKLWKPRTPSATAWKKDRSYGRAYKKKSWTSRNTAVFRALHKWREQVARDADESPHFVCPSSLLVDAAVQPPHNLEALQQICTPLPPVLEDTALGYADRFLEAVAHALHQPAVPESTKKEQSNGAVKESYAAEAKQQKSFDGLLPISVTQALTVAALGCLAVSFTLMAWRRAKNGKFI